MNHPDDATLTRLRGERDHPAHAVLRALDAVSRMPRREPGGTYAAGGPLPPGTVLAVDPARDGAAVLAFDPPTRPVDPLRAAYGGSTAPEPTYPHRDPIGPAYDEDAYSD